jgi:hypothetical protein
MTNKTRDQKFQECFRVYMNNLQIDDINYYFDYSLINRTENKTKCVHMYVLHIFGSMESEFHTGENVVDILPTNGQFVRHMKNYFEPYQLKERADTFISSYVYISTSENTQPVTRIEFDVIYHKDHLPFPVPLTETERYQLEISELQNRLDSQGRRYEKLKRKFTQERLYVKNIQIRVQEKMAIQYAKFQVLEDCPVCYDPIEKENIRIPLCFHYICSQCKSRCDKCPLCRESYISTH